jgi:hypothetical protein
LVEVVFDSPHEVSEEDDAVVQGGTLVLDPKRFWCLRSYDVRAKIPNAAGTIEFRVLELKASAESFPVPRRCVCDKRFAAGDGTSNHQQWQYEYDLSVPRRLPADKEFTLSAFGLPEPRLGGTQGLLPPYVWVALAGLACLACGAVFQVLKRRAATRAAR